MVRFKNTVFSNFHLIASIGSGLASRGGRGACAGVRASDRKGTVSDVCASLELEEVEEWDWISEVSPVIQSMTFAVRMNAGKQDNHQWTKLTITSSGTEKPPVNGSSNRIRAALGLTLFRGIARRNFDADLDLGIWGIADGGGVI